MTSTAPKAQPQKVVQHQLTYRDAEGQEWDGVAERVGKVGGRTIYKIVIPADPFSGYQGRVLPIMASGLASASGVLADYYEDRGTFAKSEAGQ